MSLPITITITVAIAESLLMPAAVVVVVGAVSVFVGGVARLPLIVLLGDGILHATFMWRLRAQL